MSNTPTIIDFRDIEIDSIQAEHKANKKTGRVFGTFATSDKQQIHTQTPWLRTPGALTSQTNFGLDYFLACSLIAPNIDESVKSDNDEMVQDFENFVRGCENKLVQVAKENWKNWFGVELSESVLEELVKSLIVPEQDGYPAKYNFKMTKHINSNGEFKGLVFQQPYDKESNEFLDEEFEQASITDMKKHARVRLQLCLKNFYVWVNEEDPSKTRLGLNWVVEQIVFYNPYDTEVDTEESVYTTCTFSNNLKRTTPTQGGVNKRTRMVIVENTNETDANADEETPMKKVKV